MEQMIKTNLEKYGVENVFQNKKIIDKCKKTKLIKYDDGDYNNREKCNKTVKEKYGVDNIFQLEEIKNLSKQTKKEIYGNEHYINLEKACQTKLKKYGDKNFNNREKMFETRFGISYNEYLEQLPDYIRYRNEVLKFTRKQPLNLLKNYDKRRPKDYHLDHRFSIKQGFIENIPPFIIGNIVNLEMLPWRDNVSKNYKCSMIKEELFEKFDNRDKTLEQLKENYNK